MGMMRKRHPPTFSDSLFVKMRDYASKGCESRDAWQTMIERKEIPPETKLETFRTQASKAHITWGKFGVGKQAISFLLGPNEAHALSQAAAKRNTTRNLLAQLLIYTIAKDSLFNAILDDTNDPQRPDDPTK